MDMLDSQQPLDEDFPPHYIIYPGFEQGVKGQGDTHFLFFWVTQASQERQICLGTYVR
jgi:hypothetical protein